MTNDRNPIRIPLAAAALWAMTAAPAGAQEAATPPFFESTPITDGELATVTGRENSNWMSATSTNTAVVTDNRVGDNNVTGNVNVTDSAFQNVSGISMVNFNTGNNSAINAGMSINLQINYAAQPTLP